MRPCPGDRSSFHGNFRRLGLDDVMAIFRARHRLEAVSKF